MLRLYKIILLSGTLMLPVASIPALQAQTYHDEGHNDEHHWDSHEDRAYRIWAKEQHRKYVEFSKLKAEDQRAYWAWRHEHSDVVLKIR